MPPDATTAPPTQRRQGGDADAVAAGLAEAEQAWLWRLAVRLMECDSLAEAEALAATATTAGRAGSSALARAVADTVGPALTGIRERERLRGLVVRDPLTGLHNRRFLEEELAGQIERMTRQSLPLALAILDLDRFRDYNERHGHPAGDLALQLLGLLLQGFRRAGEVPCRYGGEEFVLIMPAVTAAEARARLEPLLAALAAVGPHREGRLLPPVSASVGVAEFPAHGRTPAALFDAADAAMYRAKRAGRNCVRLAEADPESRTAGD